MDSRFSRIKSSADLASLDQPSLREYMRQLFTAYGYTVTVPDDEQFGDVLLLRLKHGSGAFDLTVTLVVCDGTQSSSKWFEQHVLDAMKLYKSDYLWLVGPHADHVKLSHKTMRLNIQVISRKVMDDRIAHARMPDATAGVASQTRNLGRWGTCPLTLRPDGTLIVGAGSAGNGALAEALGDQAASVREVRLSGRVVAPSFGYEAFAGLASVERMDLRGLDTSSVTSMSWMFEDCVSLSSLDASGWDTSSVTSMAGMFSGCESLATLDVSGWDTSSVTDMAYMFFECNKLDSLDEL